MCCQHECCRTAGTQDDAAWQQRRLLYRQVTHVAPDGVVSAAETSQATLQGPAHSWWPSQVPGMHALNTLRWLYCACVRSQLLHKTGPQEDEERLLVLSTDLPVTS